MDVQVSSCTVKVIKGVFRINLYGRFIIFEGTTKIILFTSCNCSRPDRAVRVRGRSPSPLCPTRSCPVRPVGRQHHPASGACAVRLLAQLGPFSTGGGPVGAAHRRRGVIGRDPPGGQGPSRCDRRRTPGRTRSGDGRSPRMLSPGETAELVVTVCDRAHEELDPTDSWWHWSIPDPVAVGIRRRVRRCRRRSRCSYQCSRQPRRSTATMDNDDMTTPTGRERKVTR